ncbi:hypothetical protein OCL06_14145 [Alteromonas sp. ASW11-19]|uniref:Uncharacterized protein n=1 Tax=Alteromonas salexigens TaxID=2982530 RepID=A0ABT2VRP2_9ALTE|nr:hypothetical protein [Alteromonas salexigens]MCU7555729.1 hypothetical protein [Alteromonas salexigens]
MLRAIRGVTLVGLLVSLAIASAFFASAATLTLQQLARLAVLHHQLMLEEDIRLLIRAIRTELQRGGYVALPLSQRLSPPPAAAVFGQLTLAAYPGEPAGSCVLFAYDKNKNGTPNSLNPAELLGFRLRDGALEYRMAGRNCTQGGWQDITSSAHIRLRQFVIGAPVAAGYGAALPVTLAGESVANPNLQHSVTFTVPMPNIVVP